jgi:hypothetical protein
MCLGSFFISYLPACSSETISNSIFTYSTYYPVETIFASGDWSYLIKPINQFYYSPQTRFIYSKEVNGDCIILDDGSEWRIYNGQRVVRENWWKDDPIVVSPSQWPFFTGCRFYITNLRDGNWVHAEIINTPIANGPFTNVIIGIDSVYGKICLADGRGIETFWEVHPEDISLIQGWKLYQHVFLGMSYDPINTKNVYYTFDSMLFNIEKNHFIKARRG